MSIHIGAEVGQIAPIVLLPGDPLRAKHIAETFLSDVVQYNEVRGMLGFTGNYKGHRISVQGTGMGIPSMSIYAHELMDSYGAQKLIRVGTCGAIVPQVAVRDVILAMSASTDSAVNRMRLGNIDYAPTANFSLLLETYNVAIENQVRVKVGSVMSTDSFYGEDEATVAMYAAYGIMALEMEAAALYTLAARFGRKALAVLTVSDHLLTGEQTTAQERQTTFNQMIQLSLDAAVRG